jgi:hypothetical protein
VYSEPLSRPASPRLNALSACSEALNKPRRSTQSCNSGAQPGELVLVSLVCSQLICALSHLRLARARAVSDDDRGTGTHSLSGPPRPLEGADPDIPMPDLVDAGRQERSSTSGAEGAIPASPLLGSTDGLVQEPWLTSPPHHSAGHRSWRNASPGYLHFEQHRKRKPSGCCRTLANRIVRPDHRRLGKEYE